ncbi:Cro/Cl family transcriptional regulator [Variovorax atrisoli]|uniref:Cro/Cl family transcriptional regulator n=1 Tax=Variovorax atrisoli TaxID=3394203 RepID=UPI0012FD21F5|nr:Cro/Cl family transcriptional regulator [Variovorax paradoxus]
MNTAIVRSHDIPGYAYGNAWKEFSRSEQRAVEPASKANSSKFLSVQGLGGAMVALVVGTGGVFSTDYVVARDSKGYPLPEFNYGAEHERNFSSRARQRSSVESISLIREVFKPSITELASAFGVSRQAIYNWQAGQPIAEQNEIRLAEMANAAELLSSHGFANTANLARRRLPGGTSFFEAAKSGANLEAAAKQLIALLASESAQRTALSERLATRRSKSVALDDLGSPHLNEQV